MKCPFLCVSVSLTSRLFEEFVLNFWSCFVRRSFPRCPPSLLATSSTGPVLAQLDPTFRTQRLELLVDVYRIRVHLDCRDYTYRRGANRLDKDQGLCQPEDRGLY